MKTNILRLNNYPAITMAIPSDQAGNWRSRNTASINRRSNNPFRNLLVSMLVIGAAAIATSPLISVYSPLQGNLIFVLLTSLVVFINFRHVKVSRSENNLIICVLILNLIYAAYWNNLKLALHSAYLIFSIIVVSTLSDRSKSHIVECMTNIMLVMTAGAVAGFVYAFIGGASILSLDNTDGRPAELYLFTLSNEVIGNIIRPAGIFDEPGALSFYICFTAASRHILGLSKGKTWLLLIFGFITFSLAHLIYSLCHFLSEKILSRKSFVLAVIMAISISVLLMCDIPAIDHTIKIFGDMLIKRLEIVDGSLAGDNRSHLFTNAVNYLNPSVFLFGIDSLCVTDWVQCQRNYLKFGENPLMPLVQGGVTATASYYLLIAAILYLSIKSRTRLIHLGILALLVQRPNVMSFGYCLLIYFVFKLDKPAESNRRRNA